MITYSLIIRGKFSALYTKFAQIQDENKSSLPGLILAKKSRIFPFELTNAAPELAYCVTPSVIVLVVSIDQSLSC
jgi:hypothetical protein